MNTETVGTKLAALGKTKTVWLDLNTHQEVSGTFDPTQTDRAKRYGCPVGSTGTTKIFGWPQRNYTGAHATGGNDRAVELAPKVFGVSPSPFDQEDLDFVDGATAHVISEAARLGIRTADEMVGTLETAAPKAAPTSTPAPAHAPTHAAPTLKDQASAALHDIAKAFPTGGGGQWVHKLQDLSNAILSEGKA